MVLVRGGAMAARVHRHHHQQNHHQYEPKLKRMNRRVSRQDHMNELLNERKRIEKETFDHWFQEFELSSKESEEQKELNREELSNLIVALRGEPGDYDDVVDQILVGIHTEKKYISTSDSETNDLNNTTTTIRKKPSIKTSNNDSSPANVNNMKQVEEDLDTFLLPPANAVVIKDTVRRRNTIIQKDQLKSAVEKYIARCREHQHLDLMFSRYDTDNSGFLETNEVRQLMLAAIRGDVIDLAPDEPRAREAKCVAYKLKCLDELRRKGILSYKSWHEKREHLAQRHKEVMTPALSHRDPDDTDITFVLSQCDTNGDGKIDRNELMLAITLWIRISKEADQYRYSQSKLCSIM